MCKGSEQSMIQENNGVIVNVTAVVTNGFAGMAHTGAARAGVINLTKSVNECAHLGIRINCVSPGIIWSDSAAKNYNPFIIVMHLLYRLNGLTVDEVSSMITFLSSMQLRIYQVKFHCRWLLGCLGSFGKSIILLKNPFKVTLGQSICMEEPAFNYGTSP